LEQDLASPKAVISTRVVRARAVVGHKRKIKSGADFPSITYSEQTIQSQDKFILRYIAGFLFELITKIEAGWRTNEIFSVVVWLVGGAD
jgi:hypothetical protein